MELLLLLLVTDLQDSTSEDQTMDEAKPGIYRRTAPKTRGSERYWVVMEWKAAILG